MASSNEDFEFEERRKDPVILASKYNVDRVYPALPYN